MGATALTSLIDTSITITKVPTKVKYTEGGNLKVGDVLDEGTVENIKVYFNIRGRKWENNGQVSYFTNLEGWRIEKLTQQTVGLNVALLYIDTLILQNQEKCVKQKIKAPEAYFS